MSSDALVTNKGARRWAAGHPWIYRSDVTGRPEAPAGVVRVRDPRGTTIGVGLWSPTSEISLRLLDSDADARIDAEWWYDRLRRAIARRTPLIGETTAYRLVHGEGDGLPSLVCDRYDRWLVVQLMSAGVEQFRGSIMDALRSLTGAEGILARNDAALREREALSREITLLHGSVPEEIEVEEHGVRYLAAPWSGQKTGAFLDQRENRTLVGTIARGRALDCFSYHGSFALHLAGGAEHVDVLDSSAPALARARENAARNGFTSMSFVQADAFDFLREREQEGARYDTIVLDPPAFAKTRATVQSGLRGYKEVNLRAMRLLAPGGMLFTASCSFHLNKPRFLEMLESAAADSGRRMTLRTITTQPLDHPELLTVPETGYLKGALIEAMD